VLHAAAQGGAGEDDPLRGRRKVDGRDRSPSGNGPAGRQPVAEAVLRGAAGRARGSRARGDRPRRFPPGAGGRAEGTGLSSCRRPTALSLSRFSRTELHRLVVERGLSEASASTIWRWLHDDAVKPWQQRSWVFVRDPSRRRRRGIARALGVSAAVRALRGARRRPRGARRFRRRPRRSTSTRSRRGSTSGCACRRG
jgi:hypothetical protein